MIKISISSHRKPLIVLYDKSDDNVVQVLESFDMPLLFCSFNLKIVSKCVTASATIVFSLPCLFLWHQRRVVIRRRHGKIRMSHDHSPGIHFYNWGLGDREKVTFDKNWIPLPFIHLQQPDCTPRPQDNRLFKN